jgi:hypothetical protein
MMKVIAEKIVAVVLSMAVLLISSRALANQQTQGEPPGDAKREVSTKAPDLRLRVGWKTLQLKANTQRSRRI